MRSIDSAWTPPEAFDEYRLIRQVGSGRASVVHLAHDTLLDRHVAIKFIPSADDAVLGRFLLEARAAARIQHPNVATLYRVGELEGRPYLVSEFVRGQCLDKLEEPLSADAVLRVALDLTRGLVAAHRRGVLHRDIKPGNAILGDGGDCKLLDFGLAKLLPAFAWPDEPRPRAVAAGGAAAAQPALSVEDEEELQEMTHGQLLGTPYFMPPEMWRLEEATERSDLYSLGVLLYELCAGRGPFRDVPLADLPSVVQHSDPRPLQSVAPEVPEGLATVIDQCVKRNPAERFDCAEHLLTQLVALRPSPGGASIPEGNPYRGLRPFESEHRALFFGRRSALLRAMERLRTDPLLLLTGDSGVGKSSLAAAGVIPLVTEGELEDGMSWSVVRFFPGREPTVAAAAALAPVIDMDEGPLEQLLREDPRTLARVARQNLDSGRGLLVYVDQLEELVSQSSPAQATAVSEALGALASGIPGLRVLATARSDFLSRLEALTGFRDLVSRSLFLLAPLSRDEVREAIVGPATATGTRFESDELVDRLVESTVEGDGGTPLLQFTLAALWERRDAEGVIGQDALEAVGGVSGALSRHADHLLEGLRPVERSAARTLLLRLVTIERTRTRRLGDELTALTPHAAPVLEALVRGRLLVVSDTTQGAAYEIAHEALVAGWETLAGWLAEEAETRALVHRLEVAASDWRRHERSADLLWSKRQLAEVAGIDPPSLTPGEREFLDESRRARRRRRRLVWAAAVATVVALLGIGFGSRWKAQQDFEREIATEIERAERQIRQAQALDERLEEHRAAAFRTFDEGRLAEAEEVWTEVLSLRQRVLEQYGKAAQPLERALLLDGNRKNLRRRYAELLYRRAVVAERQRLIEARDELASRMLLYDDGGTLKERWETGASLDLATEPAGASVRLSRYYDQAGRLVPEVVADLGAAPLRDVAVAPGSLLLEIELEGHAPVRYPLVASRGQRLSLSIPLPRAQDVPEDFVWVPPGEFFYGSADEGSVRAFFNAVPQHPATTRGFLIDRFETTFADWIDFLEALPADERARRTPRLGAPGVNSTRSLALRELEPGTWELHFQLGSTPRKARSGEHIRYSQRSEQADQDWLEFPVVGISRDDAQAYADWLHHSGRVPGARLCTEVEWERAARGADRRIFPHGDALAPDDANIDETHGKVQASLGPDEVGSHPVSQSPFGVEDLAGNAWEWVQSSVGNEGVTRGGSYDLAASTAQIANRVTPEEEYRDINLGLRICATSPVGE